MNKKSAILSLVCIFALAGCSTDEGDGNENTELTSPVSLTTILPSNQTSISSDLSTDPSISTTSAAASKSTDVSTSGSISKPISISTSQSTIEPTSVHTSQPTSISTSEHTTIPTSTPTSEVPATSYSSSSGHTSGESSNNSMPTASISTSESTSTSISRPEYVVNFDLNGGTSSSYNGSVKITEFTEDIFFFDCVKEGFNFRGWSYNGTKVFDENGSLLCEPSLDSYMTFEAIYVQTAKMTIITNIDGAGSINGQGEYTYNSYVDISAHPNKGYNFVGWYYQNTLLSNTEDYKYMMWSEDVTLEARFKLASFLMNIHTNNENCGLVLLKSPSISGYQYECQEYRDYTTQVTIAAYSKTDVRFLGWYDTNNNLVETNAVYTFTMPNYNYTLEAKWNYFVVSYNLYGGTNNSLNPTNYTSESSNLTLYEPTKIGYEFLGWKYNDNYVTEINSSWAKNIELNAVWKARDYSITYELNGGTNNQNNPSSYSIEDATIALSQPTRPAYTFGGWYVNSDFSDAGMSQIKKGSYGDMTLYAKWIPVQYSITYELNGGINNLNNPSSYNVENNSIVLSNPTKVHYDFVGWQYEGNIIDEINPNWIKDITLEAIWTPHAYSITYNLDGATNDPNNASQYNVESGTIALNDPTKEGYRFYGWYSEPEFNNGVTKINASNGGDITLYAKFVEIFDVILNPGEGLLTNTTIKVCYGEEYTLPVPTAPTGYEFDYWAVGNNIIEQSGIWTYSTQTTTLTAVYKLSGLKFTLSQDGQYYIVSSYEGTATNVVLPDEYRFKPVREIVSKAFKDCSSLTSITIPDSVTSIGSGAFFGCSKLESIALPFVGGASAAGASSQTSFGYIFGTTSYTGGIGIKQNYSTSSYTYYYIPSSLKNVKITGKKIPSYAFYNCSGLTSIIVGDSVTRIGSWAFYNCSSLTSIVIPDSVTSIYEYAFTGCSNLESITLPFVGEGLSATEASSSTLFGYIFGDRSYSGGAATKQYYDYYSDCYETYYIPVLLKNVTITGGQIFHGAFYGCSRLTSVTIGNGVTSIGNRAFYDCSSLTSIVIPDSVTSIGDSAFYNCSKLISATIGNGVTLIGNYAFYDCSSLTSIVIPDSVTSIGENAFCGCSNLTSVTIGDNVTSIGDHAFSGCSSLTSVIIPNSVTSVGKCVFYDGYSSMIIYCRAKSKPTGWNMWWDETLSSQHYTVVWGYTGE